MAVMADTEEATEADAENTNSPRRGVGLNLIFLKQKTAMSGFLFAENEFFWYSFFVTILHERVVQLAPPWRGEVERCPDIFQFNNERVVQW